MRLKDEKWEGIWRQLQENGNVKNGKAKRWCKSKTSTEEETKEGGKEEEGALQPWENGQTGQGNLDDGETEKGKRKAKPTKSLPPNSCWMLRIRDEWEWIDGGMGWWVGEWTNEECWMLNAEWKWRELYESKNRTAAYTDCLTETERNVQLAVRLRMSMCFESQKHSKLAVSSELCYACSN